jgi:hypothetical protein
MINIPGITLEAVKKEKMIINNKGSIKGRILPSCPEGFCISFNCTIAIIKDLHWVLLNDG